MKCARFLLSLSLCLALPGCYVKTYGVQSSGGGANATVVASQTAASTGFSNGRASFSFGQPVPAGAPGGQVSLGRGGGLVLAAGLVVAEALQVVGDWFRPQPGLAQIPAGERISETCSCYRSNDEVTK